MLGILYFFTVFRGKNILNRIILIYMFIFFILNIEIFNYKVFLNLLNSSIFWGGGSNEFNIYA